jgi:hypothetical protein
MIISGPAWSQEQLAIKTRFELTKSGSFAGTVWSGADPTLIGVAIQAGCAAFGADCSGPATAISTIIKGIKQSQTVSGGDVHGIYSAPVGWEICKAKIDWAHTGISGGSTFNSVIVRDAVNNGLGYYAFVEQAPGHGTGITSDVYLYFVKAGKTAAYGCMPTRTNPWICTGKDCAAGSGQRILPEARYP